MSAYHITSFVKLIFVIVGVPFFLFAQTIKKPADWVVIRHATEVGLINPIINNQPKAQNVANFVFQSLNGVHPKTLESIPCLANLPQRSEDGKSQFFEIRPEAVWADNSPVTGEDVIFTLKAIKNPRVKTTRLRHFYENVQDIVIDKNNPKKFEVKFTQVGMNIGMLKILPKYLFDAQNLMDKISLQKLNQDTVELVDNPKVIKFAEQFNNEDYNKTILLTQAGSGAYYLSEWKLNDELVLLRKESWWGDQYYKDSGELFVANPKRIVFKVVSDMKLTLNMFRLEELDVLYDLPSQEFVELAKADSNYFHFKLRNSNTLEYLSIGINTKKEGILSDKLFRKALAQCIDIDYLLTKVAKDYGRRLSCPGIPDKGVGYNSKIPVIDYKPEQTIKLLENMGWKDMDEEGIRYKMIEGKKESLKLTLSILEGNPDYRKIAHHIGTQFKEVGIALELIERNIADQTKALSSKNFDLYLTKITEGVGIVNPYPTWHTKSPNNFTGFGNDASDALINDILKEKDANRKKALYDALQEYIMEANPVILLWSPQAKIAVNARFQNVNVYLTTIYFPGFNPASFYTPTELVRYKN